ncbi:hypothetical protein [Mycolicibacterium vanbaalenii]|nr:hypothetical protein [Mycolicibacterium vanbaalenii]
MSDHEHEWRERLKPVRLVVESDFTADEVRAAHKRYGAAARQLFLRGWTYEQFIKRFPALTVFVLVGHAALEYDQGRYWDSFWDELGMGRDADFENELRAKLFGLLDKFSLARSPRIERERAFRYVMTLTMHAGIPAHCLADLLLVINTHISQGRPATGAAVVEWLEEPGKEHRLDTLDVPVRNFLLNGAEFAIDILDRIIEFVEAAAADPTLLDRYLDSSTTGLPDVLLHELIKQLREEPLDFEPKRLTSRGSRQPAITYDVDDDEIVLELPAPGADPDLPWRVSFDGDVRHVRPTRKWGGDAQSAKTAVPGPVREIVMAHPSVPSMSLPLVVKSDPLLVFEKSGRWVPRRDGLKDCAWAIFPEAYALVDSYTKEAVEASDMGSPAGWRGWRSVFVELDDIAGLQLLAADGTEIGSPRTVRKDARPSFRLGEAIPGVYSADGRTVYGSRPWVMLPPSHSDPGPEWTVRVRRLGEPEWLVEEKWRAEGVETCVDPLDEAETSQLGLFEIVVTGPLGSDARCVVFMAEGLTATFDTWVRVPQDGGLSPCTADVSAESFTVLPAQPIAFDSRRLDAQAQLEDNKNAVALVVRPPHVEIRSGEVGSPAAWRMTAEVCDPEDFAQNRFVAIRAPGIDSVVFGYVSPHGDLLQGDPSPRRRQGDVFECRTQQFADTVRSHPAGRIVATLTSSDASVEVAVLHAQPKRLASDVRLDEDKLIFSDIADLDDLAVYVWSTTAPWRPAEVLTVVDGTAALPSFLIEAGALRCQLFVDDPWMLIEPPSTPSDSAFNVEQWGWREDGTPAEVKLSRYLGSERSAPKEVGAIPEVWAAMAQLHADSRTDRFEGLIELLEENPRRALESLGDSTIAAGDKMAMLIRSELVNQDYSAEETLNELHAHPWFGCMVELADLPSLFHRRDEVREERKQTLAYLRDRGGLPLIDLLRTGMNSHADWACFDDNVYRWTRVDGAQIEAKLQEIQQVPRAQLHPESLRAGVYEAFCRRREWVSTGWSTNYAQQLSFVVNPIKKVSRPSYEAVAARCERVRRIDHTENPWILMSVESLTLALLARLEAHGRIGGQYLNRGLLVDWARLAQLCPVMVSNDILIAEALILHERRVDFVGEGV